MRLAIILMIIATAMLFLLFTASIQPTQDNQITSSATKHSYDDNSLQPKKGDGSGMAIITISGLD